MMKLINAGVISAVAPYSDAVSVSGPGGLLVVTSGIPGFHPDGRLAVTFEEQANCAWNNIASILATAGLALTDVVRVTHYLVRREDLAIYREICASHLGQHRPASMLSFAAGLPWPDMLVELHVEAFKASPT